MADAHPLEVFVGEWTAAGTLPLDDPIDFTGRATFEWLGQFLVYRATIDDQPSFPTVLAVIEPLDTGDYTQHYFDSRGVKRTYDMTFDGTTWQLIRMGADDDFFQRFTGVVSDDKRTIDAQWEIAEDKVTFEFDFGLTYTKVG